MPTSAVINDVKCGSTTLSLIFTFALSDDTVYILRVRVLCFTPYI